MMEAKTMNPSQLRGSRDIYCPYYSACLDLVIKKQWMDWSCSKCEQGFKREKEMEIPINVNYHIAYYELSIKT